MKYSILKVAGIACLGIALVFSCKKTPTTSIITPVTSSSTLNQLFADLRSTPQTITVNAGRDTIVFGSSGTAIHLYTHTFKNASGTPITSGTVTLQLTEMYTPGSMIANRATTVAGTQLLQSGGQVNLTATVSGSAVQVTNYGLGFKQNTASSIAMNLFNGRLITVTL